MRRLESRVIFSGTSSGQRHVVTLEAINFLVRRAVFIGTLERLLARWAPVIVDDAVTFLSLRNHRLTRNTQCLAVSHNRCFVGRTARRSLTQVASGCGMMPTISAAFLISMARKSS